MQRASSATSSVLTTVIVIAVPLVLVGNGLWLLLGSWMIDVAYALPGFPADEQGLEGEQRSELAKIGLESIRPFGEGADALRAAELPDGAAAFDADEIRHMEDVRALVGGVLITWALALVIALTSAFGLLHRAGAAAVKRAVSLGAIGTLVAMTVLGLFALVAFDTFFTAFHGVFFEGDTWRFDDGATLRRIYPDAFWAIASGFIVVLVTIQAGALALFGRARLGDDVGG